jgi:MFS family permease
VQQGFGVLGPFLIADFAITKAAFGAVFTAMVLGTAVCTALAGALTDRLGERRIIALSAAGMTVALLAAAAFENYLWLLVLMFAFGVAYSPQPSAGTRAVLQWFDRDRAFAMSLRQSGVPLGGMVGGLLLPLVALHLGGYRAALLVAAALVAVPAAVVVFVYRHPPGTVPRLSQSYGGLLRAMGPILRDRRVMALSICGIGLSGLQSATNSFLVLTDVNVVGLSAVVAAGAYSVASGSAVVGRLFWSWISDRFLGGERYGVIAALSLTAAAAAVAAGSLRPAAAWLAVPIAAMLGISAAGWNGVYLTAVAEIGGVQRTGSVIGVTSTVIFAASAITPGTFGLIAERTSLATAWYTFAAVALVGVLPPLWLLLSPTPAAPRSSRSESVPTDG